MGILLIGDAARISASDANLDRVADLLENPPNAGGGFWIAGQLDVESDGEPGHPNPQYGHQRLWVPAGTLLTLVYDRPLHPDPDEIIDDAATIFL